MCRSFLGSYIDENGEYKVDGRFNWNVTSVNLVRLALQSNKDEKEFFKRLRNALDDCKRLTQGRFEILRHVKAKQAQVLYMSGAIARLNAEDEIEPLLLNGYSSVSIGYVGLQNCLVALYGKGLEDKSEFIINKAKNIMQFIRDYCEEQKKITGFGFSMYGTPKIVGL